VRRALLCSGRIYYRLLEERQQRGLAPVDVPIMRLEQMYPFPAGELRAALAGYPTLERLVWVQEEPRNMGAWRNLLHRFEAIVPSGASLEYAGRSSRAVAATGSFEVHQQEEAELLESALAGAGAGAVARSVA
jgi:2-oxoglutarate dehydrogenase E1 component